MLKQFFNKPISSAFNKAYSSVIKEFEIPKRFIAPYYSLYNIVGLPIQPIEEGEKKFQWYLNNQIVEHERDENGEIIKDQLKLTTPDFDDPIFQGGKANSHRFLVSKINKECYTATRDSMKLSIIPKDCQFFWNPKLLSTYEEMMNSEDQNCQIIGPKNMGKSFNLIFYTLLHRLYRNETCKVLLICHPQRWFKQSTMGILLQELVMAFGEELHYVNHHNHKKTQEVFTEIFKLANARNKEIDEKVHEIMTLIRTILCGKKLYFFQDQSDVFAKQRAKNEGEDSEILLRVEQVLMGNCDKTLQVRALTEEGLQEEDPEKANMYAYCEMPFETGRYMLNSIRQGQKLSCTQSYEVLNRIGQYPGVISEFAKKREIPNKTWKETLNQFYDRQKINVEKEYEQFKQKHSEGPEKVVECALEIGKQLYNNETAILDPNYTDLRHFYCDEISKEGVPTSSAVNYFYSKLYSKQKGAQSQNVYNQ